ncbi:hypothetical protein TNIN_226441 [Trichonephila inaurata madagascariensis]|uniref:Uncharacterized protein n=1 Tax=Trichonephila inaurata madagascariensis TaxID=2747483 RepID=A0A8X6Y019_9ARAC|nr:hypothetical protein TNIN_226441 [Trichonephila inaurata madagascariensis]
MLYLFVGPKDDGYFALIVLTMGLTDIYVHDDSPKRPLKSGTLFEKPKYLRLPHPRYFPQFSIVTSSKPPQTIQPRPRRSLGRVIVQEFTWVSKTLCSPKSTCTEIVQNLQLPEISSRSVNRTMRSARLSAGDLQVARRAGGEKMSSKTLAEEGRRSESGSTRSRSEVQRNANRGSPGKKP